MLCYLDEDLKGVFETTPSAPDAAEQQDDLRYLLALLKQFGVCHKTVSNDTTTTVTLFPQKVTLDDVDMNTLFFEALHPCFPYRMEYSPMGGRGCEFAIRLRQGHTSPSTT